MTQHNKLSYRNNILGSRGTISQNAPKFSNPNTAEPAEGAYGAPHTLGRKLYWEGGGPKIKRTERKEKEGTIMEGEGRLGSFIFLFVVSPRNNRKLICRTHCFVEKYCSDVMATGDGDIYRRLIKLNTTNATNC